MLIAKWKKQGYEKVGLPPAILYELLNADLFCVALLPPLHPAKGDELQQHLHLSSSTRAAERGPGDPMCELRVPRMFKWRLMPDLRMENDGARPSRIEPSKTSIINAVRLCETYELYFQSTLIRLIGTLDANAIERYAMCYLLCQTCRKL